MDEDDSYDPDADDDHDEDDHDHGHGEALPFEDDCRIAWQALARLDLDHARHHIASAIATRADDPECDKLVAAFADLAGADPLAFIPDEGLWYGLGALRAALLVRAGRHDEAVPLLLACLAAVPDAPFVPWLRRWLDQPGVIAALDPEQVAVELTNCARHEPLGAALHELARRIHDAHPDHDRLAFAAIKLARLCWRYADAIAIGRAAIARGAMPMAAIGLAGALRNDGDPEGAIAALREALRHQPDNAGILLDLGDLSLDLGRPADAVTAYEAALALDPDNAWARPSRLYARWRVSGADDDAGALRAWASSNPGDARAAELVARLIS